MDAIARINATQTIDEIQALAEELLIDIDLSDEILTAIENRQRELYTPSAKDIAEKKLRAGLAKSARFEKSRNHGAFLRQSKANKRLFAEHKALS